MTNEQNDEQPPIDYSPASSAVDPEAAAQDQSESTKTSRHAYTENATFIGGIIPSTAINETALADERGDREPVKRYYDTLNQLNRDFTTGQVDTDETDDNVEHLEQRRREHDRQNDVIAWGRQIGLSGPEIDFAVEMMSALSDGIRRAHGTDTLVLATLSLAANNKDVTTVKSIRLDHGIDTGHTELTTNFEGIRSDLNIEPASITAARKDIT